MPLAQGWMFGGIELADSGLQKVSLDVRDITFARQHVETLRRMKP